MRRTTRTACLALIAALACSVPAQGLGATEDRPVAPIHPTAKQAVVLTQLTTDVTRLVGLTRTITSGVDIQTPTIVALRQSFVHWNRTSGPTLPQKLAPAVVLGRRGVAVLDAMKLLETRGGAASSARVRVAVASFNSAVVAFSDLPFA